MTRIPPLRRPEVDPVFDEAAETKGMPLMEMLNRNNRTLDHEEIQRCLVRYRIEHDLEARDMLVSHFTDMVRYLAGKFSHRGEPLDDLVQVGLIALTRAMDRFDMSRGVSFATYVTPTILGELKRYFRDKSWALKIPRRLKDLAVALGRTVGELTASFGRPPTLKEIAETLDASEEEIIEAQELMRNRTALPFSRDPSSNGSGEPDLQSCIGAEDGNLECIESSMVLKGAFRALDERERAVIFLRFYEGMAQSRVAEILGVSQMHVSRLLVKIMEKLRAQLQEKS